MAIRRALHVISQMRVDVSDIRAIESAVRNDFDEMIQAFVTGNQQSFVIRGFELNMTGAVGNAANGLAVVVSDSAILHTTSLTSGTIFKVSPGTPVEILSSTVNNKVIGNFSPNSTNYISVDFARAPDASTQAPRAIWDPTNKLETSKVLPLAQLLTYTFKVTTTGFAPETLPLAIVQTDAANNVTSVTDRRPMLYRLGQAGFGAPNPSYSYPWSNHSEGRTENAPTSSSASSPFRGGDKQIKSLKEWMDAVMSILREITGGVYWYSLGAGGSISTIRSDGLNTVITGRATVTHSATTPGQLNWNFPIRNRVIGSRLTYNLNAYSAGTDLTLADGQVAYLTLTRDVIIGPNLIFTNGGSTVTSVGAIGWTTDLQAGDYIKVEGAEVEGYQEILSVDSVSQVTLAAPYGGAGTGAPGTKAQYAFGVYTVVTSPSTARHVRIASRDAVPLSQNMYWLFFRDDNGSSVPKIYTRFKSGEIEQGESQEVSDNVSLELLQFIGATGENDSTPAYSSTNYVTADTSLVTGVSDLDAALFAAAGSNGQDRSLKLIDGGVWSYGGSGEIAVAESTARSTASSMDASAFLGQAFEADTSGELSSISVPLAAGVGFVGTGTIALRIYSVGAPTYAVSAPFGSLLGTSTTTVDVATLQYFPIDVNDVVNYTFSFTGVTLTAGQRYAFVIDTTGVTFTANFLGVVGVGTGDPYPEGGRLGTTDFVNFTESASPELTFSVKIEAGIALSWSDTAYLDVPGVTRVSNEIPAGLVTFAGATDVAYVEANRTSGADTLTVAVTPVEDLVVTPNTVIIARRVADGVVVGRASFLLKEGERLELDGALAELNRRDSQLRMTKNDEEPGILRIAGASSLMLDEYTKLSKTYENLLLAFDGAVIDFSTGEVFEADGTTPLGTDFTPVSMASGEGMWFGLGLELAAINPENTQAVTLLVTPSGILDVDLDAGFYPEISSSIKLGFVYVSYDGTNYNVEQVRPLTAGGGSGGGSGDASELLERLKARFADNPFTWLLANIFAQDGNAKVDDASSALYSSSQKAYVFENISDELLSTSIFDPEFGAEETDINSVELIAYWDPAAFDASALYEASRDGGDTWETIPMSRIGSTDTVRGILRWAPDVTFDTLSEIPYADATDVRELNATTRQSYGQRFESFVSTDQETFQRATVHLEKTGSPLGRTFVQLVRDNGADLPSTDPDDVVAQATIDHADLNAGNNTVTVDWGNIALASAPLHLVIATDAIYKASFSTGVTAVALAVDDTAPIGPISATQYDGAAWTDTSTEALAYTILGRPLELYIRITGGTAGAILKGYGVYYGRIDQNIVSGIKNRQVFQFNGTVDNENVFTLTNFLPDSALLKVYHVETGQVYIPGTGAFLLNGFEATFAPNTFSAFGTVTLVFDQAYGTAFDNSDENAALLTANFLGSTDTAIDKSQPGRGIFLRRPDGTLREITIDDSDNIVIYSV